MNTQNGQEAEGEPAPQASTWSQDRRLKFIEFRLRWDGRINRNDLTDFFSLSVPQASADLSKYSEAAPLNLSYDTKAKCYVKADGFSPIYARSSSRTYLNELLALATNVIEPKSSFIGWRPDLGVAPIPGRTLDGQVLSYVVQAIREKLKLSVWYQGMSRPDPIARELSPHALAFDGFRWHVRAYCHLRSAFQDFVIGRLTDVRIGDISDVDRSADQPWNEMLTLILAPHPGLSPGGKRAICMEYGMIDGSVQLSCRQALLFYALRRLKLDQVEDPKQAASQQIVLLNREDLQPYIDQLTTKGTQ
jgi:WYL domain